MATLKARQNAVDAYVGARLAPGVSDLQASYAATHARTVLLPTPAMTIGGA